MKQFTVITKDGSKWLRPTDVLSGVFDVIYTGIHPERTVLSGEQVTRIQQVRTPNTVWRPYMGSATSREEVRIAYTDAEPHDRHTRPFKTHNVRPLVNQLVGEEISFSRFVELLNEEAAKWAN